MIAIGAYKAGTNPKLDYAIDKIEKVNQFLMQKVDESFHADEIFQMMKEVLR